MKSMALCLGVEHDLRRNTAPHANGRTPGGRGELFRTEARGVEHGRVAPAADDAGAAVIALSPLGDVAHHVEDARVAAMAGPVVPRHRSGAAVGSADVALPFHGVIAIG